LDSQLEAHYHHEDTPIIIHLRPCPCYTCNSSCCRLLLVHYFFFHHLMARLLKYSCPFRQQGCSKRFRSQGGRTYHIRTCHTNYNIVTPPLSPPNPQRSESPEFIAPTSSSPRQDEDPIIPHPRSPSPSPPTQQRKQHHPWLTGENICCYYLVSII
jgi:hypothetical protein